MTSIDNIITSLETSNHLSDLISNVCRNSESKSNLLDLKQDIYVQLIENSEKTIDLYEKKELDYYLVKLIQNSIYSTTSRYYKKYKKFSDLSTSLPEEEYYD